MKIHPNQRLFSTRSRDSRGACGEHGLSGRQLDAFVKNLKSPHLFVTLSAADHHWDDLMQRMPRYEAWSTGTSAERIGIARENLRDNPLIAAYWFHTQFQVFKREVLHNKFNVVDDWSRIVALPWYLLV
ncbi:hypothetical protein Egran_02176 [Elaphomyces granulatus]|uniref:Helitron helicase-like domain-containing protein n=1 Tax=Elaphomyces granulatus TaxID=519963 RepID=A0A232M0Y0_9EURO|nr:hypothetical protein Egran_02176 [Elaphomyces granulatus]